MHSERQFIEMHAPFVRKLIVFSYILRSFNKAIAIVGVATKHNKLVRSALVGAGDIGAFGNQDFRFAVFVHRCLVVKPVLVSSAHERGKQRMGAKRFRLVLRMKLTTQKPWMNLTRKLEISTNFPSGETPLKTDRLFRGLRGTPD